MRKKSLIDGFSLICVYTQSTFFFYFTKSGFDTGVLLRVLSFFRILSRSAMLREQKRKFSYSPVFVSLHSSGDANPRCAVKWHLWGLLFSKSGRNVPHDV